jgi:acyl carrier protein
MNIFAELNAIFCSVFNDDEIMITNETNANDIEKWDSLSHANLVLSIENHFKIKFSNREMLRWKNVGDILASIKEKTGGE